MASPFQQVTGIEPALSAWEAEVLPLNHTCVNGYIINHPAGFFNTLYHLFSVTAHPPRKVFITSAIIPAAIAAVSQLLTFC